MGLIQSKIGLPAPCLPRDCLVVGMLSLVSGCSMYSRPASSSLLHPPGAITWASSQFQLLVWFTFLQSEVLVEELKLESPWRVGERQVLQASMCWWCWLCEPSISFLFPGLCPRWHVVVGSVPGQWFPHCSGNNSLRRSLLECCSVHYYGRNSLKSCVSSTSYDLVRIQSPKLRFFLDWSRKNTGA